MRAGLLARVAETMFWSGRYVERADDTARMLDVYVHRMVAGAQQDEEAGCRALLAVLGVPATDGRPPDLDLTLHRLAYDAASPSAIAGAVVAAHEGIRSVREVVSSEMWECLNVTRQGLAEQRWTADRLGPNVYLRFVRERAALFFGLADATLSHDDAWRFLILGQSLERVDMTSRLLLARMPGVADDSGWPVVLRACGGYESFLRSRGWAAGGFQQVAEFLLLDRLFPRSVRHALTTAEECLAALEPVPATPVPADAARRQIGRLRMRLEYPDTDLLPGHLPVLLRDLQEGCREAADAITTRYFTGGQPVSWELEG